MKAVEDPNWESIKAMFDHLIADERNRLPDLVALRQAIYRQPGMVADDAAHARAAGPARSATATCSARTTGGRSSTPTLDDRLGPGLQRVLEHLARASPS